MRIALIAMLVFFVSDIHAQSTCNSVLEGHVKDAHDKEALGFATIYIPSLDKAVVSNAEGHYEIDNLCAGTYIVECRHLSCDIIIDTIEVNGIVHHDFYPEHHTEVLDAIHLVDEHVTDHASLSEAEKAEVIGLSFSDQLESLSGVNTLKSGGGISKPVIHGFTGNRITIVNNGVKQQGQQWGNDHAPELDPFANQQTEVIKGASGVLYGPDAIGGVVKTEMGTISTERGFDTKIMIGGASNGRKYQWALQNEGVLPWLHGFKWRTVLSHSRWGNTLSPGYYVANTGGETKNVALQMNYHVGRLQSELIYSNYQDQLGIYSGSHVGNLSDLQSAFDAEQPLIKSDFTYDIGGPYQAALHELLKLKVNYLFEYSKLELDVSRQFNERKEFDAHSLDAPDLDLNLTTKSVNARWIVPGKGAYSVKLGAQTEWQTNTSDRRPFIPNFQKQSYGAYALIGLRKEIWKWELGLRQDYVTQQAYLLVNNTVEKDDYSFFQPSFGLSAIYQKDRLWWKQSLGGAWRPPHVSELYANGIHHGAASFEIGDKNLNAERNISYQSEWDYVWKALHFKVEAWVNFTENYIYLNPQDEPILTVKGAFPAFKYEQTDAFLRGMGLQAMYEITDQLNYSGQYNITRGNHWDSKAYIIMLPADRLTQRLDYKKVLKGSKEWRVGIAHRFIAKQSRVPEGVGYLPPPASYQLWSLSTGLHFKAKSTTWKFNVSVDNLFNQSYRDYLNRMRYYADDMGRNIRLSLILNL